MSVYDGILGLYLRFLFEVFIVIRMSLPTNVKVINPFYFLVLFPP